MSDKYLRTVKSFEIVRGETIVGPRIPFEEAEDMRYPVGFYVPNASSVQLINCTVSGAAIGLLTGSAQQGLVVENLNVTDCPSHHGLYISQCIGCQFRNISVSRTWYQGAKWQTKGDGADSRGNLIENLRISQARSHGLLVTQSSGTGRMYDSLFKNLVIQVDSESTGSHIVVIGPHEIWLENVSLIGSSGAQNPVRAEGGATVHGLSQIKYYKS